MSVVILENCFLHTNGQDTQVPIFVKMLPDKDEAIGITLTVCDVQEPISPCSQIPKRGYGCSLTSNNMELQLDHECMIPIYPERHLLQKGKHSPHSAIQDRKPVIQIDFAVKYTKE